MKINLIKIKTPKEIFIKHSNDEHHDEFDKTGISFNKRF